MPASASRPAADLGHGDLGRPAPGQADGVHGRLGRQGEGLVGGGDDDAHPVAGLEAVHDAGQRDRDLGRVGGVGRQAGQGQRRDEARRQGHRAVRADVVELGEERGGAAGRGDGERRRWARRPPRRAASSSALSKAANCPGISTAAPPRAAPREPSPGRLVIAAGVPPAGVTTGWAGPRSAMPVRRASSAPSSPGYRSARTVCVPPCTEPTPLPPSPVGAGNSKPGARVGALAPQVEVEPARDLLAQVLGDPVGGLRVVAAGEPDHLDRRAVRGDAPGVGVGLTEAEQRVLGALDEQGRGLDAVEHGRRAAAVEDRGDLRRERPGGRGGLVRGADVGAEPAAQQRLLHEGGVERRQVGPRGLRAAAAAAGEGRRAARPWAPIRRRRTAPPTAACRRRRRRPGAWRRPFPRRRPNRSATGRARRSGSSR